MCRRDSRELDRQLRIKDQLVTWSILAMSLPAIQGVTGIMSSFPQNARIDVIRQCSSNV